jgi:hypothetical protein
MKKFVQAILILSLLAAGCSNLVPEERELIGQWRTYGEAGVIDLEILPDHTYSYYTPALRGYGLVEDQLIDIPAKNRYGKWRVEKNIYEEKYWNAGGVWKACCICVTPEDGTVGGGCNPYTLEGDNLTTDFTIFPIPTLGDVLFPIEWTRENSQ